MTARQRFSCWEGGIRALDVPGKPSSKQDAIGRPWGHLLKISVTAAPRTGRATGHRVRLPAEEFGVAPSDIEVGIGRMKLSKLRIPQATAGGHGPAGLMRTVV